MWTLEESRLKMRSYFVRQCTYWSLTLSCTFRTSLRLSGNYKGFQRSKDEPARYCWQDKTRDFNNSSGIWNKKASKWQKSKRSYGSYNIGLSTVYGMKKWKDQLWSFMASSACVQDDLKWQTLKVPKLAQLDKELYMCFTAVHSEGNPVTSFDNW